MGKKVGIIGYHLSSFQDELREGAEEGIFNASTSALENAKISLEEVYTVIIPTLDAYDGITISNAWLIAPAGGFNKDTTRVENGGIAAIISACGSLLSKSGEFVLVASADGVAFDGAIISNASFDPFFLRPLGVNNVMSYALIATAYMKANNITERDLALIAAKDYQGGVKNPQAHIKKGYSGEDVSASPMVCWPLRSLEIAPISKGGAALVLASEEKTRELMSNPVWITGFGAGTSPYFVDWTNKLEMPGLKHACANAYKMAGIKDPAAEIDVAEVFDPFPPFELLAYEALGLCETGKAMELFHSGKTSRDGEKPVNPSGGSLCTNPPCTGGLFRTIKAVEYLKATDRAKIAVVQDSDAFLGFGGESHNVLVLEKEV